MNFTKQSLIQGTLLLAVWLAGAACLVLASVALALNLSPAQAWTLALLASGVAVTLGLLLELLTRILKPSSQAPRSLSGGLPTPLTLEKLL